MVITFQYIVSSSPQWEARLAELEKNPTLEEQKE